MAENDNKRVAKNTLILYLRMFITMAIGIWTSRLVLNALGFTDQGLYNVVAGFVGLTSLITASISGSISRFITYETGRGNTSKVNRVVQNAISVQWILAIIVIILAETIGLWFLNNRLVIPIDRLFAVNVIYQLSIGNIVISLISSAPTALIWAHEKFNVSATVAIVNSVIALGIGLAITYFGGDRLILYALLQFFAALGVRIFYAVYCRRTFPDLKFRFAFDKEIFFPIFSFAGWNSLGSSAAILRTSGTSILLNIFGGPIVNTINGIANSVNNLATVFVNDFTTAYSPQITKKYAVGAYGELIPFLHQCSKLSYALLAVMAIPIFFNVEPLLILWLKEIPDGTVIFARLVIIYSLIECICKPLVGAKNATGKIRNYQIIVGGILLLTIPLTYVFLKLGLPLYFSYISMIITSTGAFIARMVMLQGDIPMWSTMRFLGTTVLRCVLATIVGIVLPWILHITMNSSMLSTLGQCAIGFVWCASALYFIALNTSERAAVIRMIKPTLSRIFKKNAK